MLPSPEQSKLQLEEQLVRRLLLDHILAHPEGLEQEEDLLEGLDHMLQAQEKTVETMEAAVAVGGQEEEVEDYEPLQIQHGVRRTAFPEAPVEMAELPAEWEEKVEMAELLDPMAQLGLAEVLGPLEQ